MLMVTLLPHTSFISMVMLQIHYIVQGSAGNDTKNFSQPLQTNITQTYECYTLKHSIEPEENAQRIIFLHKCKCWLVFPTGPQWPADHGQLQIRNTQVEKKLFYACPRCQGANSECNPTCNTCSSPNYRVILAGQNLANFCKVGISSDSEANSWERPKKYFVSFVTQYLMQDILFGRNAHCSISKLRGLWGFSKGHQRTFYSLTKTNNCFSQFSGLTRDPQKALGIREAYIDVQKHRPVLVLMDLSLRQRINHKTSSVEPNNHLLTRG